MHACMCVCVLVARDNCDQINATHSESVFTRPFPRDLVVLGPVGLADLRYFGAEGIVGVGVGQQGADR